VRPQPHRAGPRSDTVHKRRDITIIRVRLVCQPAHRAQRAIRRLLARGSYPASRLRTASIADGRCWQFGAAGSQSLSELAGERPQARLDRFQGHVRLAGCSEPFFSSAPICKRLPWRGWSAHADMREHCPDLLNLGRGHWPSSRNSSRPDSRVSRGHGGGEPEHRGRQAFSLSMWRCRSLGRRRSCCRPCLVYDPPSSDSDSRADRSAITDRAWSSSRSEGPASGAVCGREVTACRGPSVPRSRLGVHPAGS
jgi:hypothetical protein